MHSSLSDEVARFVKAYSVAFGITHRLADAGIIGLTGVSVLRRTFEPVNSLLFEPRYYLCISASFRFM
jgi:hypothetical protein